MPDEGIETLIRDACRGIYQEREAVYRITLLQHGVPLSGALSRVYPHEESGGSRLCVERPLGSEGSVEERIKYNESFLEFLFLPGRLESLGPFSGISYRVFRPGEDIGRIELSLDIAPFYLTDIDSGAPSLASILLDKATGWEMEGFAVSAGGNPPIHVSRSKSNQIAYFDSYQGGRYVITLDVRQYVSSWIGFFRVTPKAGDTLPFNYSMTLIPPRGVLRTTPGGNAEDADPPEYRVKTLIAEGTVPDTDPCERVEFTFTREITLTRDMLP